LFYDGSFATPAVSDIGGNFPPHNNQPPIVTNAVIFSYNPNLPGDPQTLTHQFVATDVDTPAGPFTWDMLTLVSYTPNYGGTIAGTHTPLIAPTLSSSGEFEWISEGSRRGDYVWQVRATDSAGLSDLGTITVHVVVPEPSTLAMFGLAMVGGIGLFRRRNR
jgi:hypothetical protein